MTVPLRVIRATSPYTTGDGYVPTLRYWNDRTGWGRYDEATRYPTQGPLPTPPGPRKNSTVEAMPVHPTDLNGGPYAADTGIGAYRVTECCAAAATYLEGQLCCKSCYDGVDDACGGAARLDGRWIPPAPITLTLPIEEH